MLDNKNIKDRIDNFYKNSGLKKEKTLVGFSGGVDSTTLLLLLNEYLSGNVIAVYFVHNIRNSLEQDREIEHIKSFCKTYRISLQIKHSLVDIKSEAIKQKMSLEDLARKERYKALKSSLNENNAYYIALAHNKNDNLETILMRFFQGSFFDGLQGIPEINERVIRPLIHVSRPEIDDFILENNINISLDSSNLENVYLRNKIRNRLIPVIKEFFPNFDKSLKRISLFSKDLSDYYDSKNILPFNKGRFYYSFLVKDFFSLPRYLVYRTIFSILNAEGINFRISYDSLGEIFKMDPKRKKSVILLNEAKFFLEIRRDKINLILKKYIKNFESFNIVVLANKWYSLHFGKILLEYELKFGSFLRICSYDNKYLVFDEKKTAKKFFAKFTNYNPTYLVLLLLNTKLVGIIDLNTLNLLWNDEIILNESILKKFSIFVVGGLDKE